MTDKDGVYTPLHVSPAIRASEMTLLVTLGPGVQSLEPGEFGIIHGDYRMPLDNCEYLLDFNHEDYGSIKWCLFKKKKKERCFIAGHRSIFAGSSGHAVGWPNGCAHHCTCQALTATAS